MANNWWSRALCATDDVDPEWFFPIGDTRAGHQAEAIAKGLCARCPVREDCLADAIRQNDREGIRGGLNEQERAVAHRRRRSWVRRTDEAATG